MLIFSFPNKICWVFFIFRLIFVQKPNYKKVYFSQILACYFLFSRLSDRCARFTPHGQSHSFQKYLLVNKVAIPTQCLMNRELVCLEGKFPLIIPYSS